MWEDNHAWWLGKDLEENGHLGYPADFTRTDWGRALKTWEYFELDTAQIYVFATPTFSSSLGMYQEWDNKKCINCRVGNLIKKYHEAEIYMG
jgi:hypothetical protein